MKILLAALLLTVATAFSAVHTNYVDTASTPGGDGSTTNLTGATRAYASLREAVDAIATEAFALNGGTNYRAHEVVCRASTGLPDTLSVPQGAWTYHDTPSTYTRITVAQGHRHDGRWSPTKYRHELTNSHGIYNSIPGSVELDGLQIQVTVTSSIGGVNWEIFRLTTQGAGEGRDDNVCRISNCIAVKVDGGGTDLANGFMNSDYADGASGSLYVWNNLAIGCDSGFQTAGTQPKYHINNTAVRCGYGYINPMIVINCLAAFSGTKSFESVGTGGGLNDYNAGDDPVGLGTPVPGANSRNNQTFTFVNTNFGDYRLDIADTGARNYGLADPAVTVFSTDFEGQARSNIYDGAWDIGFDEAYYMLPATNRIDWSLAGVPNLNGIRGTRTNWVVLTGADLDTNGVLDCYSVIQSNLTACPSNGIVVLPVGRLVISNALSIHHSSSSRGGWKTLLGAGKDLTTIVNKTPGTALASGNETGRYASNQVTYAGLFQGATNMAVRDTPDFLVGDMIVLYRQDEAATNFSLTFGNSYLTNTMIVTNTVESVDYLVGEGEWYNWKSSDRFQQFVRCTAIDGTNVSFWPPLNYSWTNEPGLYAYVKGVMGTAFHVGIEDLTFTNHNGAIKMLSMTTQYGSWVKNCQFLGVIDSLTYWSETLQCEIRDSDFINPSGTNVPGGDLMGITMGSAHHTKVENNVFSGYWSSIMMNNSCGNFIAYNHFTNALNFDSASTGHQQPEIMVNHIPHSMMNLVEGNILAGFHADNYHGSSSHNVIFRNNIHGMDHAFGLNLTNRIRAIDICRYGYHFSVVGNILLSPETATASSFYDAPTNGTFNATTPAAFRLGFPDTGNDGFGDAVYITWLGANGTTVYGYPIRHDGRVEATLRRKNNYDFKTPGIADGSTNIPASWVYGELTPLFLRGYTHPAANPAAGTMALIPAQERFYNGEAEGGGEEDEPEPRTIVPQGLRIQGAAIR